MMASSFVADDTALEPCSDSGRATRSDPSTRNLETLFDSGRGTASVSLFRQNATPSSARARENKADKVSAVLRYELAFRLRLLTVT